LVVSDLVEAYEMTVKARDHEVREFLDRTIPGWDGKEPFGFSIGDLLFAAAEAFPPPFGHCDVFGGRIDKAGGRTRRQWIQQGERWRRNDALTVRVIMESPERPKQYRKRLRDFIAKRYKPFMRKRLQMSESEMELLDDFETTVALLDGKADAIWKDSRTFRVSFPLRDVTNSLLWLELLDGVDSTRERRRVPEGMCLLPVQAPDPAFLHLLSYFLASAGSIFPDLSWTVMRLT